MQLSDHEKKIHLGKKGILEKEEKALVEIDEFPELSILIPWTFFESFGNG